MTEQDYAATEAAERLALVRQYVAANLGAWTCPGYPGEPERAHMLEIAYADIYKKVLNVIDTGSPMGGQK